MKAFVAGIVHRKGIAKSGNPYDFCTLLTLQPFSPVSSEKMTARGAGFQVVEVAADPSVIAQLTKEQLPRELELLTDARANNFGQLELVVTGVGK